MLRSCKSSIECSARVAPCSSASANRCTMKEWESTTPLNFAYAVAGTFLAITITFFIYDGFVRRRNKVIVKAAARSNKIVASLFPSNVRDRLLAEDGLKKKPAGEQGTQTRLRNFLENGATFWAIELLWTTVDSSFLCPSQNLQVFFLP